jgi:hypothetical protein
VLKRDVVLALLAFLLLGVAPVILLMLAAPGAFW